MFKKKNRKHIAIVLRASKKESLWGDLWLGLKICGRRVHFKRTLLLALVLLILYRKLLYYDIVHSEKESH